MGHQSADLPGLEEPASRRFAWLVANQLLWDRNPAIPQITKGRFGTVGSNPRFASRRASHLCTLTLAEVPGKGKRPEQSWLDHRAGGSSTRRLCNSAVGVWIAPVSSVLDLSSNSTSLKP